MSSLNNDVISLLDIVSTLKRRKWMFLSLFLVSTFLGLFLVSITPDRYVFNSSYEIGRTINRNNNIRYIETPASVVKKLYSAYIPVGLDSIVEKDGPVPTNEVSVHRVIKNSGLVVIKSIGTIDEKFRIEAVHKRIFDSLLSDHQRVFAAIKYNREVVVATEKSKLALIKASERDFLADDVWTEETTHFYGKLQKKKALAEIALLDAENNNIKQIEQSRIIAIGVQSRQELLPKKLRFVAVALAGILVGLSGVFACEIMSVVTPNISRER